jgi:DNA-binding NtrC family response regulator
MVGQHPTMVSLLRQASQVATLPLPVIISGPTGSGKECVADAIHRLAAPRGRLVVVNVTTIPESLVDSELFGSVRGAFSGAQDRAGLVEAAQNGTLVLDEASDLPMTVQARLLRVVERNTFRRLGSPQERTASFRLMLTTQDDPAALVAARRWRADFYHRVAGTVLRVPSLKDRASDIPDLIEHFAALAGLQGICGSFELCSSSNGRGTFASSSAW